MASTSMTDQSARQLVLEAVRYVQPKNLPAELPFDVPIASLGIESLASLEMVSYVESKLDIEFSEEELARITTLADFVTRILERTQKVA